MLHRFLEVVVVVVVCDPGPLTLTHLPTYVLIEQFRSSNGDEA